VTTIGGPDCTINLRKDPYVSPEHARITYLNGRFHLEDRGSLNGVFVRLGGSVPLTSGDLLLLGLGVLRFEIVDESERNLAPQTRDGTRVFGTPPAPRYARLTTQTVEGVARDRHYLSRAETVLGREVGDIVFTDDPFMSRRHAAIQREPSSGHFTIRDLGSSNGTFIALRGEHALAPGDHIRIGQHLFRLDVRDDR
jgi:pSer/pThr/pTyr-binding forkhead associated (FHA) protein